MAEMKDGGPAFPIPNATDMDGYVYAADARGMSLRDWFAGQALAGLCSNPSIVDGGDAYAQTDFAAKVAMIAADAMLAARESRP